MPAIRALIVVLAACGLSLWAAAPTSAGGPTSALLSVPGEGRTASLYYTDADYERLADLVDAEGTGGGVDQTGGGHAVGVGVTVTWLIHDVTPWRVDRIYLRGDGAPWIATQVMTDETESIWDGPVVWHQPGDGKALVALLGRLGVIAGGAAASQAGDGSGGDGEAQTVAGATGRSAAPTPAAAPDNDGSGTSLLDRALWGLGGLAGGGLLVAGWGRVRAAREDLAAEAGGHDPGKDYLAPLSSP